ncbi:Gamma-glutamylputrescine oxidoreductase [Baekduia alba]|uniref:NAD(P)/FAD-dependent oxidoreductase n=1 Tax=Baekduia alba TaxID=2997333 RepID=UPI002341D901|nr:FAD-binding oxidoreductase [Baekduia alba]WCB94148.1 Gamma-glutamylputrescine oxidoreductase [Baekduia alba]
MPRPWPTTPPTAAHRAAYADAKTVSFWLDDLPERARDAPLAGITDADLCIVGGGFTGLWAALHAKADDPSRDVVVLEADVAGGGASGRNGGFMVASLTHGLANGLARFPDEMVALERLAFENFEGIKADLKTYNIDAQLEETGELGVLLEAHEVAAAEEDAELLRGYGHEVDVLDAAAMHAQVASPTYLGGVWDRSGGALVHPGRLAAGLREAALRAGVRIHEHTPATTMTAAKAAVTIGTPGGAVRARRVLLATSAYPSLLGRLAHYVVPVYDYVLVTEPLSAAQKDAIGWRNRQGIGDGGNQFHYYRQTGDDRILWGGFDAVYRRGGPVGAHLDDHDPTFGTLSQHFFTTFPQLEGLRFTHRWGGAIDTCSRFSVFFGTARGGRVAYATGYTGLGVAATRFGARVGLDLLDGRETEATRLQYVRRRPVPFPPEPLRTGVIALTQRELARADRHEGRRGLWLRTLDRLGLGFDS